MAGGMNGMMDANRTEQGGGTMTKGMEKKAMEGLKGMEVDEQDERDE